jgi:hypothetical protein
MMPAQAIGVGRSLMKKADDRHRRLLRARRGHDDFTRCPRVITRHMPVSIRCRIRALDPSCDQDRSLEDNGKIDHLLHG